MYLFNRYILDGAGVQLKTANFTAYWKPVNGLVGNLQIKWFSSDAD